MSDAGCECVVFDVGKLTPEAWRIPTAAGPVRTFNPGLLRDGDGWILAYRVVAPDGRRRIGICRLNRALEIIEDSAQPLSDQVRFRPDGIYAAIATEWFADPRLYRFGGRVFVYWNSGWHEPRNYQFLQELDPATLEPRGHPREMLLRGERQKLEKNWTLFAVDPTKSSSTDRLFAVYSILPHRVLEFSLAGDGDIVFEEIFRVDWSAPDYPRSHGGLRGGAPPQLVNGTFWSFCHSVHDGADGYTYAPAAYCFASQSPFAPCAAPTRPLPLGNPFGGRRTHERLNPAVGEVIYPCGAAWDGTRWLISHGLNDEYCALSILSADDVARTLRTVEPPR